jgi:hypothetical protein
VVEVCHSWFNRFRKLLVRYEKRDRSFLALNHMFSLERGNSALTRLTRRVTMTRRSLHWVGRTLGS